MSFSILELVSYFGGFFGLVLVVVILTTMKGKKTIKISLSFILTVSSLTVILGAWGYSGKMIYTPHLFRIDSPIHLLGAPSYYILTLALLKKDFKFRPILLLNFIPAFINLIEFFPLFLSSGDDKLLSYNNYILEHGSLSLHNHYMLKIAVAWGYFGAQLYVFNKYVLKTSSQKVTDKYIRKWVSFFLAGQFACYAGFLADQLTGLNLTSDPYKLSITLILIIELVLVFSLIFTPRVLYGSLTSDEKIQKKYLYSSLSEDDKLKIFSLWQDFIGDKSKPYLSPKLTLPEVAEKLKTNPQRLSQVINEKSHMSFSDYLNYMRVEEAKKLLSGDKYENFTIDAIAHESGFNSKSPFYKSFKKFTGMTPKLFIEKLTNKDRSEFSE